MNSAAYRFLNLIAALTLAALTLLSIRTLQAQTAVTGAISGFVSDASGASMAGASVETTNIATGVAEKSDTNNDGVYRFPSLIPGSYTVKIEKPGFATFTREAFRVDAGTVVRIDAALPVATVSTAVDVSGQAPIL